MLVSLGWLKEHEEWGRVIGMGWVRKPSGAGSCRFCTYPSFADESR